VTAARLSVLSAASEVVRVAPGPELLGPPRISGSLGVGSKLAAHAGVWSGGGTISFAFQWYRCSSRGAKCSTLRGSTAATYTQVAADAGHTLALTVRASDSTGTTAAYSSLAGLVAPAGATFVTRRSAALDGIPAVGQELRVASPAFTAKPDSLVYAWLRCSPTVRSCAPIAGASAAAYTVTADDAGHTIVASVTAAAAGERRVALSTAAAIPPR
jgi:hypothetical protein